MARITIRCTEALLARLDDLAAARGVPRARLVRQLILEASPGPPDGPPMPSERELLDLLAEKARGGNVGAIRTLLDREAADPETEFEKLIGHRLRGGDRQ